MAVCVRKCIVIGAGIGGLTTALRLAAQGYQVQVLEKQSQIGGKLNQLVRDGFSFDTGPSLITMPFVLQSLFTDVGRRLDDYLTLTPLDVTCQYFYRDGLVLNAWHDTERLRAEFARLNAHDAEALVRFIEHGRRIYQAAASPFLYHSLGSPFDVMKTLFQYVLYGHEDGKDRGTTWRERLGAVMTALAPTTLDRNVSNFFQDEHLRQLFDRYATYNGSSPYQLASVYSIIPYVELAFGGWYLQGGIYTLAQALRRLAKELGVEIQTDCSVRRILVERGQVRGVVLEDGNVLRSDVVIANSDVVTTHRELLAPEVRDERVVRRLERLEPSCSGFVLLLGVNKRYPQLQHHNIFFSDDYPAEFADLFERKIPIQNPTIYICASSRTDATQAPAGHENLFVLVNAPYLSEKVDWRREAEAYRELVLNRLGEYPEAGLADIRQHIVCEQMLTPLDFYEKYGANRGSIYGLSSNSRLAPFTRPGNRAQGIRNLYFVGGSTHPGGGIPLVMLSGKIVSEMVQEDM